MPVSRSFEQQAKVGVGFQSKWYRSQREHWLGWITVKERKDGTNLAAAPASRRWNSHSSPPMLSWLAEAAGVDAETFERAAEAAVDAIGGSGKESAATAKAVREVIPWATVENALRCRPEPDGDTILAIDDEANGAWERLVAKNPRYR